MKILNINLLKSHQSIKKLDIPKFRLNSSQKELSRHIQNFFQDLWFLRYGQIKLQCMHIKLVEFYSSFLLDLPIYVYLLIFYSASSLQRNNPSYSTICFQIYVRTEQIKSTEKKRQKKITNDKFNRKCKIWKSQTAKSQRLSLNRVIQEYISVDQHQMLLCKVREKNNKKNIQQVKGKMLTDILRNYINRLTSNVTLQSRKKYQLKNVHKLIFPRN
eukprot:TRINITY_DN3298_c0_g1_i2.p1 TRINITY_DN3298_c0_g1~~TRINITY_DN3298_c0_g1_i2.p1  ORF type:complete len:216 (-),score=-21.28 TRINITY_DN3298_c0_g1_i2:18-665(-)